MININGFIKLTLLDYPGETACTVFTPGCNFRCPFCHNSDLVNHNVSLSYTDNEIIEYLKQRKGIISGICITGGEPTIQKDLIQFIEKIKNNVDIKLKLDTNGTHPIIVEHLIRDGLIDYVAMDIKANMYRYLPVIGLNEIDEKKEFQIKNSITRSIKFLINQNKIDYEFRTTVVGGLNNISDFTGYSYKYIEQDWNSIGQMIKGANKYYLQAYKDSGNILQKDNKFYTPSKEELLKYANIVKPYVKEVGIRGID